MTLIFGRFNRERSPVTGDQLLAPAASAAVWRHAVCALGYQSHQAGVDLDSPLHDDRAQLAVVASARLDNRDHLAQLLKVAADEYANATDADLLLRAYQRWGTDCPRHLLGDYAFVIWDGARQQLFAARDYIGVRPLYYAVDHRRFLFASTAAILCAQPDVADDLDLPFIAAFLRRGQNYPHPTRTFYQAIHKLAPAHALLINNGALRTWRTWCAEQAPRYHYRNERDAAAHLRDLLGVAVRDRLPPVGAAAAHISGGLDCSSIAVLASRSQRQNNQPLYGYCWSPPPTAALAQHDERRLVNDISRREDLEVIFAEASVSDSLALMLSHFVLEQDVGFAHERALRRHAVHNNVATLLSGWGGDEFISFNGRGYLADLLRRGRWRTLRRELSQQAAIHDGSRWRALLLSAVVPNLPDSVVAHLRPNLLPGLWQPLPLPELFHPQFDAQLHAATPLPHLRGRERPGVHAVQLQLLANGHLTYRIEGWAAAAARHGLTYAYPLLDRRIVELALSLPPALFFQNGWKRYLFRHACRDILPDSVAWRRSKNDPALNDDRQRLGQQLRRRLLPLLHQILDNAPACRLLDVQRARQITTARLNGDRSVDGDVLGALKVEMLVNRHLTTHVAAALQQNKPAASHLSI